MTGSTLHLVSEGLRDLGLASLSCAISLALIISVRKLNASGRTRLTFAGIWTFLLGLMTVKRPQ